MRSTQAVNRALIKRAVFNLIFKLLSISLAPEIHLYDFLVSK